ncbi:hypothetical protein KAJ41_01135 [Candidatus Parcubacteria bacterium]|nr:hypothetical protein [Candidatus Parcubacteria bacterium]
MDINKLSRKEINNIINNKSLRVGLCKNSHKWFFNIYFGHYITHETADFHHKMFLLTENEDIPVLGIVAFRGCAKSTIFTMSFPMWSIIGKQNKKFIVLLGETQRQARQHLINIRKELECNELLRSDLGPFKEIEDEWGSYSLVIPKYNARITAASMEQTIRGMRHNQYRPDLIICDDIENLNNVRTKEGRDKVYNWITGEVIPAGDLSTRIIFIGNLLHEDSLLMRIKDKIKNDELDGKFYEIPLIDENNKITWSGKYPDMKSIEKEKKKIGNKIAWEREYMLRIVSDFGKVVHLDWIHYYENFPSHKDFLFTITGIDLAISQNVSADYTAMVSANVYIENNELLICILPNPINEKLSFPETVERSKLLSKSLGSGYPTELVIESVGYQPALIQELQDKGFPAEGFPVKGQDKRARLALTTHMIKSGRILFPKNGAEQLIQQLVGFGVEKHDDLADAFAIVVLQSLKKGDEYLYELIAFLA